MTNDDNSKDIGNDNAAFSSDYESQMHTPKVPNADNEWLGSYDTPAFSVGAVDEVNGPGAAEVVGFIPTRHELLELARYWTTVAVDLGYWWFLYQQVGSSEMRRQPFAWRRVARIQELLGADVDKVVDEVYEKFGKKEDNKCWEAFLHGNEEQREAVREEIARAMQEPDSNQNDQ